MAGASKGDRILVGLRLKSRMKEWRANRRGAFAEQHDQLVLGESSH